jgi:hypothetical protein
MNRRLSVPVLIGVAGLVSGLSALAGPEAGRPDHVAANVLRYLGPDAVVCGRFKYQFLRGSKPSPAEIRLLQTCMATAFQEKRTFYFSIEGSGVDSYVASGLMRSRSGELERFWYDSGDPGGPQIFRVGPCPTPPDVEHIDPFMACSRERASSPTRG